MLEKVKQHLTSSATKYKCLADKHRRKKAFNEIDFVMVHLNKARLPVGIFYKLHDR